MSFYILIAAIVICMIMSVKSLFTNTDSKNKQLSMENLMWLAMLYSTIMIGFALLFLLFELRNFSVMLDQGMRVEGGVLKQFETALYFSAVTMFSVGYGDVIPIGIGRFIATIEAFIGYTLPAAFVVRTVMDFNQKDGGK